MPSNSLKNILSTAILATAFALPAYAAETKGPASVDESAPDKTGKAAKGAAGTPTLPSKGPASVNESAPQKTGKEPPAPAAKADSKKMPNPKTPSSVSESAPDKTLNGADKAKASDKAKAKSSTTTDTYK